ncbi:MAG TPA: hypothetical protein VIH72_07760 [Candidatus Acidoferrales bacterium]
MKIFFCRALAALVFSALIIPGQLTGQDTTQPENAPTPEQELQRKISSYMFQREALQKKAAKAFDAETAREKAGDCKDARTTRDIEICLEKESEITETNYSEFTGGIRELLSLGYPETAEPAAAGPTGTPPTTEDLVKEFDALQSTWQQYRKIGTTAAYNQYKGGSIAPVSSAMMGQELVRSHMRELSSIYDGSLHR